MLGKLDVNESCTFTKRVTEITEYLEKHPKDFGQSRTGSDSFKNMSHLGIFQRMTTLPSHSLISSEKSIQTFVEIH